MATYSSLSFSPLNGSYRSPRHYLSLSSRLLLPRVSLSRRFRRHQLPRRLVIRALREKEFVEELSGIEINGNGGTRVSVRESELAGNGSYTASVEVEGYLNGAENGTVVKYAKGENGSLPRVESVEVLESSEDSRRKRIEDIGEEQAWFKTGGQEKVEVSVAPGGRWNRFKTYSFIQRTVEIWGFVFLFIAKSWLSNQKFAYRGGMTEEKKAVKRKNLAKWLKESILRLGPTFIKIGQQFSTRVDILPQEYVDQLSELQDQVHPPAPHFPPEQRL